MQPSYSPDSSFSLDAYITAMLKLDGSCMPRYSVTLQAVVHAVKHLTNRSMHLLQGYLIGNGVTDSSTDNINIFSLFSSWPLISQTLAANLTEYKCATLSNPIGEPSTKCSYFGYDMLVEESPAYRMIYAVPNMLKKHWPVFSVATVYCCCCVGVTARTKYWVRLVSVHAKFCNKAAVVDSQGAWCTELFWSVLCGACHSILMMHYCFLNDVCNHLCILAI